MAAWRHEISLLVLKKYFTRSLRSIEEKFHIFTWPHEEPQEVIFLHGIWRHIKEFGIEGQIPRISSPVKLEKRC